MRRSTAGALALVLVLTLVGCGTSGGKDGAGSSEPSGASTDQGAGSRKDSEEEGGGDVVDLTDKALALDDLPTGWAEDNSDDDEDSDNPLECIEDAEGSLDAGKTGEAEVAYIDGATAPQLNQFLVQVASEDSAAKVITALDDVFDGCGSFEFEDDGEQIEGQIGKVSLPDVEGADDQANYQLTMESSGFTISAGILLLSKDDYVTMLLLLDLGSYDADQLVELGTTALAKL